MFKAENIHVSRGGREILHGISMGVPAGKLTVVLGQNGAGKSTLMHALAGDIRLSAGTVLCGGDEIKKISRKDLARRRAVLLQSTHPAFDFDVIETVMLGRLPWMSSGGETSADKSAVREALSLVGLGKEFENRRLSTLSGGEAQRVQIARMLAQATLPAGINPSEFSLFLDEPVSALDMTHRFEVMRQMLVMARRGYSVFVILHDLNLALLFADYVVILKNGKIAVAGTAAESLTEKNLFDVFGIRTEIFNGDSGSFIHILGA